MANIFMGHFGIVLDELLKHISIDTVLVENKPANEEVKRRCHKSNIRCFLVNNYEDILNIAKHIEYIELCIVASFGIILKQSFISKCRYIVNFHPGDVDVCRGKHPLPAAILNSHKTMGVTVHLINSEKIDFGPILAKYLVPIDYTRSYKYNENKLIEAMRPLTSMLMKDYLNYGRFIAYDWDNTNSTYYKPLDKKTLGKLMNSDSLTCCL